MADDLAVKDATGASRTLARKEISSKLYDQLAGLSNARVAAAASTNATSVKGSPGGIVSINVFNGNAAVRYLKLYNKASAPTVGTDVPLATFPLAIGKERDIAPPGGIDFTTGIAYAITSGIADNDTGAVSANDVHGLITYK